MNKKIVRILICTLILLTAIGAVSAAEQNSTDELMSVDSTDEIAVMEDNEAISLSENDSDVLSVNDDEVIADSDAGEVLSVNDDGVMAASDNISEVSSMENNSEPVGASDDGGDVLTVENNKESLATSIPYSSTVQGFTNYKTFTLCKFKLPIKYLKYANGYKPSKKNKKLWKQYKHYKKYQKKVQKKIKKSMVKVILKAVKNHWHSYGDPYFRYYISSKNIVYTVYQKAYRRYNYNWITNEEWWD